MSKIKSLLVTVVLLMFPLQGINAQDTGSGDSQGGAVVFSKISPDLSDYGAVSWEARWDRPYISVCWMNLPEYADERQWVRDSIERTWEDRSGVSFGSWADCTPAGADIRIQVDESGPRSHVGRGVLGRSPAMWLNFTFNSWSTGCKATREACIRSIAVHEFGHALGFQHEQLQPDAPQACVNHLKQTGQWEDLNTPLTALTSYDPNSVMNYCNSIYNNNGKLSPKDVLAIQILFPK